MVERRNKEKQGILTISDKIQNPIKFEVFRIPTSNMYSIPYTRLGIYTEFDEAEMDGMVSKINLKTAELQY